MPELRGDVLEIIPDEEISQFCDIVAEELPASIYTYNFITTCYKWRKDNPDYNVIFYRCRENRESGIFVGLVYTGNLTVGLTVYAREGDENLLKHVLLSTSRINWNQLPFVEGVQLRLNAVIEDVVRRKQLEAKLYVASNIYLLNREKALNYQIKILPDVIIRRLILDDINSIYVLWPHKDVWTIDEIKFAILSNMSYGVVSKEDNELLAWVMLSHYGAIGMLYTKERVRRHGYAKILVMAMAKEMAKVGIQPYASITAANVKSVSLFQSIGFELISPVKYITVVQK